MKLQTAWLHMAKPAHHTADRGHCVAVLVTCHREKMMLSPFFANCDGVLLVDSDVDDRQFRVNRDRTSRSASDLILDSGARRLVCGFVGAADREMLLAGGVDVRIGSCACPVDVLVQDFEMLPRA